MQTIPPSAPHLHQYESTTRDTDPNVLQNRASDPASSVWVGASAGTGKTKVLTDRVLRLLLPLSKDQAGTPPHKILCLTYTKAAASEMAIRIGRTLAAWAIMPEDAPQGITSKESTITDQPNLRETLRKLQGRPPHDYEIKAARALFAQVIDTQGGIRIMTIHSFCQSVLGRFPLEAGIRPNQNVLDDSATAKLIHQAQSHVYRTAKTDSSGETARALDSIAQTLSEDQFISILKTLLNERNQMQAIIRRNFGVDGLYTNLCKTLDIPPAQEISEIISDFCSNSALPISALWDIVGLFSASKSKEEPKTAQILGLWLEMPEEKRVQNFASFTNIFLTSELKPRGRLMTKAPAEQRPDLLDIMKDLQHAILMLLDRCNRAQCAALTRDLFFLGERIINEYQRLKSNQSGLDYDDLITLTYQLLRNETVHPELGNMPGWVHFKLDQGLDHILIDEAQDTNPEQWKIIQELCGDFFSGQSARDDTKRTLFTVGDEKQSIYSFQRASPEEFESMRRFYQAQLQQADQELQDIALKTSFRSAPSVLDAVDMVFSQPELTNDPGFSQVKHSAYRSGQAGLVEIWDLFEAEETEENQDPWEPPITLSNAKSGSSLCARHIADTIENWLKSGEILESHDRAIEAGDIMILVRTRTAFVNQLIRELKTRNIPVSGHDRMVLNNQLAVQDVLALAEFALLPHDDLTLASVLKSPLIGLDEHQLYKLAIDRHPRSLWQSLCAHTDYDAIKTYLDGFLKRAGSARPYEFISDALSLPCPAHKVSGLSAMKSRLGQDCLDPLDEILNAALRFEESNTPTLQGFVHWQKSGSFEIKRELEESGGQVRIMTIHGSKGLQAPIVIMPDTIRLQRKNPQDAGANLLWPQKTGLDLPLWAPRKTLQFNLYKDAQKTIDYKMEQEYRRLLYVAMTRAEDRLYITGYKSKKTPPEDCWYNYIRKAFEAHPGVNRREDGALYLFNPQLKEPDRQSQTTHTLPPVEALPAWLFVPAPAEPSPPQPLVPSRPSKMTAANQSHENNMLDDEPAALSPRHAGQHNRFRRGNITHKLLQFLPDIAPDLREKIAHDFLTRYAPDLDPSLHQSIAQECMAILDHPQFRPLFGSGSRAEVPITGLIHGNQLVSGQIDRLYIDARNIWVIDFKTNRPPPKNPADIPNAYKEQLRAYHDTLRALYPNHVIHCGLIWTDGPVLMPIDPVNN